MLQCSEAFFKEKALISCLPTKMDTMEIREILKKGINGNTTNLEIKIGQLSSAGHITAQTIQQHWPLSSISQLTKITKSIIT